MGGSVLPLFLSLSWWQILCLVPGTLRPAGHDLLVGLATCWQEGDNQDLAAGGDGVGFGEHRARQLFLQRAWWGKT